MSINIQSTTDEAQDIQAALGEKIETAEEIVETEKAAPEDNDEPQGENDEDESEKDDAAEDSENSDDDQPDDDQKEDDDEDEDEGAEKPKKRNGFKRRIDKLNRQKSDAQREAEYWKKEALRQQQIEQPQAQVKDVKANDDKPQADNYDTYDEYIEDLTEYKAKKILDAQRAQNEQEALKKEEQNAINSFSEQVNEFRAEHEDFDDLMLDVDDIPMSLAVKDCILEAENGAELMYELAKDREEYERICMLPVTAAYRAMGRFEARLNSKKSTNEKPKPLKKSTKTPPPLKPVSKGSSNSVTKNPDNMSFQEYKAWRAAGN